MSVRAGFQVLLGCQFNRANKLLSAAERGAEREVQEVLSVKPQLAAFAGFHGTTTPLHRAVAAGHLGTCRTIISLIRDRVDAAEEAVASGRGKQSSVKRWQTLLQTILDQRTNKGLTPLMLACDKGHTDVAAYLLSQGADPLLIDAFHCKTALHYACMGSHADCVRLLCSDETTVIINANRLPLRNAVLNDMQVQSATFLDQRSYGGLTALHYAAVSGCLDAVMQLLTAGASIMVKTDGDAYIGEEYLTPGSTPLHIAVMVRSLPLAHALIQSHAELMTVAGVGRDERRRRPWEGHSRTDIRSMRNSQRKLPYHLARERGWTQLMHLVDPRIPVDHALDAARDADHGLGPKRLATICSTVLQQSLVSWLDQCQSDMQEEQQRVATGGAGAGAVEAAAEESVEAPSVQVTVVRSSNNNKTKQAAGSSDAIVSSGRMPPWSFSALPAAASGGGGGGGGGGNNDGEAATGGSNSPSAVVSAGMEPLQSSSTDNPESVPESTGTETIAGTIRQSVDLFTPFATDGTSTAANSSVNTVSEQMPRLSLRLNVAASAPVTPRDRSWSSKYTTCNTNANSSAIINDSGNQLQPQRGSSTAPPVPSLGMLNGMSPNTTLLEPNGSLHAYVGLLSVRRPPLPHHRRRASAAPDITFAPRVAVPSSQKSSPVRLPRARSASALAADAGGGDAVSVDANVAAPGNNNINGASATMMRALSNLRDRLRSVESTVGIAITTTTSDDRASPRSCKTDGKGHSAGGSGIGCEDLSDCGSCCDGDDDDDQDSTLEQECGVCLDHAVEVAFAGCDHALCIECARHLTQQEKKPPICPFCRRMVVGFKRVSCSFTPKASSGGYGYAQQQRTDSGA